MKLFDIVLLVIIAIVAKLLFFPKGPTVCKFMRIYANANGDPVSLAEVKAVTPDGLNASDTHRGATAVQTSTNTAHHDASAGQAIDGNYDGVFDNGSVSLTLPGIGEFWQLNIVPTVIAEVTVTNRSDRAEKGIPDHLAGCTLILYDEKNKEFFRATLNKDPTQSFIIT